MQNIYPNTVYKNENPLTIQWIFWSLNPPLITHVDSAVAFSRFFRRCKCPDTSREFVAGQKKGSSWIKHGFENSSVRMHRIHIAGLIVMADMSFATKKAYKKRWDPSYSIFPFVGRFVSCYGRLKWLVLFQCSSCAGLRTWFSICCKFMDVYRILRRLLLWLPSSRVWLLWIRLLILWSTAYFPPTYSKVSGLHEGYMHCLNY